ncbi:MAG: tRNA (adenosine(37)-N6)-threonylcarbamoyltransferase complex ATPase subunit type 1 TsaE [Acidobacteria bacterium]|nr:tRNA (adenosine(37)-N6)-threonylcarbamoyltransferase complex ATPase subunit type 1 TsaE [Acidobacteriota bacterium]MBI3657817.1 tRNA (adenosine(37)-N6)-threonylcarbamoyltransferase complex ATPase subunit type 1 TsaE [Acidobacteriota bacterium]
MDRKTLIGSFVTHSEEATIRLGRRLGKSIEPPQVILLFGNLGAGKTTLTKGIAQGLGFRKPYEVISPTFVIVNEYQGRAKIFHVDLFRLSSGRDLESVGLYEMMQQPVVTIIEWAEKLVDPPESALSINIQDLGEDNRKIRIEWIGRAL